MNNPFVYGKEVSGYQFYDRTNEAEELYRHMKGGRRDDRACARKGGMTMFQIASAKDLRI